MIYTKDYTLIQAEPTAMRVGLTIGSDCSSWLSVDRVYDASIVELW